MSEIKEEKRNGGQKWQETAASNKPIMRNLREKNHPTERCWQGTGALLRSKKARPDKKLMTPQVMNEHPIRPIIQKRQHQANQLQTKLESKNYLRHDSKYMTISKPIKWYTMIAQTVTMMKDYTNSFEIQFRPFQTMEGYNPHYHDSEYGTDPYWDEDL